MGNAKCYTKYVMCKDTAVKIIFLYYEVTTNYKVYYRCTGTIHGKYISEL